MFISIWYTHSTGVCSIGGILREILFTYQLPKCRYKYLDTGIRVFLSSNLYLNTLTLNRCIAEATQCTYNIANVPVKSIVSKSMIISKRASRDYLEIVDQYPIIIRKYYTNRRCSHHEEGYPPKHLFTFAKKVSHCLSTLFSSGNGYTLIMVFMAGDAANCWISNAQ